MEPEDLLWDEVDLFLHLQANDVLLNVSLIANIFCILRIELNVKNAWMMNFNG